MTREFTYGFQWLRRRLPVGGAVVFVDGFTDSEGDGGDGDGGGRDGGGWGRFAHILTTVPALSQWDIGTFGRIAGPRVMRSAPPVGEPSMALLASLLMVAARDEDLQDYRAIALVSRGFGSLVCLRALVDDDGLAMRTSHLILFGAPDPAGDPLLIGEIRHAWQRPPGEHRVGRFLVVRTHDDCAGAGAGAGAGGGGCGGAGAPVPVSPGNRVTLPGDWSSIVRPVHGGDPVVRLMVTALSGSAAGRPAEGEMASLERKIVHRQVLEDRLAKAVSMNDHALASLVLDLEALGESQLAANVLEARKSRGPAILGVLAGRLKRRWMAERRPADGVRALSLYEEALRKAEAARDSEQACCHAINIAFLQLAFAHSPPDARRMAWRARDYCAAAPASYRRIVTDAEALVVLGEADAALDRYVEALKFQLRRNATDSRRQLATTYTRALFLAEVAGDSLTLDRLRLVFEDRYG
jgi:hypothetical protein